MPRRRFIPLVYHFFVANIAIFWLLLWLDVARIAHKIGIKSNCTMLYGHVEAPEDRP